MKKIAKFMKNYGLICFGITAFLAGLVAIPFVCVAVKSVGYAIASSIGCWLSGCFVMIGSFVGQHIIDEKSRDINTEIVLTDEDKEQLRIVKEEYQAKMLKKQEKKNKKEQKISTDNDLTL